MNILLFSEADKMAEDVITVSGRQLQHLHSVLKSQTGDTVQIGALRGNLGTARIIEITSSQALLRIEDLSRQSPPLLPLCLILGLPRPRVLHRLLQTITTLGVAELHLIQTARVEKSYWQTPLLRKEAVEQQLLLGLEQARATVPPVIQTHQRFIPYMEDVLPSFGPTCQNAFIAHPGLTDTCLPRMKHSQKHFLAIGPEGGFLAGEVSKFMDLGFLSVDLGARILKTETAVPVAIGQIATDLQCN